ncbi:hypothetical protein [Aliiglaciecola sp. LCG003]|uniref:hypothetical protein n=1 Tax=Aliiglaciecola sp. LCG003 TaxID=3053655 RepID=UPI0025727AA7|nr:hypothetical protein [Aliiglaciecola sp. LCG003]WJG09428.1 hypothetical protein QR722_19200 [Aliiglaciecola sp. LCG003]
MSVKLNHHAQPIKTNVRTNIEASFIELFIGLICAGFAYFTYDETLVLFVSTALIAGVCFLLTIYNIYIVIQDVSSQRRARNLLKDTNKDD